MNSKKLNFAIIGAGVISQYYLKAIKENKDISLVAVCDANPSKSSIATNLGINFYSQYTEMIETEKIDCVTVLTPNSTHYGIIDDCISKNMNILCEKPLCINYEQTLDLVKKAEKKNLLLITAYHRTFNNKIRKLIDFSKKKKIKSLHIKYLEDINKHSFGENWYLDKSKSGGGCLLDNGFNVINILQNLLGDLNLQFSELGYNRSSNLDCEVRAFVKMLNPEGSVGTFELDWLYDGEDKSLSVCYANGDVANIDLLAGYKKFKGSLWHEYKNLVKNVVLQLKNEREHSELLTLSASRLIDEIYSLDSLRNKYS